MATRADCPRCHGKGFYFEYSGTVGHRFTCHCDGEAEVLEVGQDAKPATPRPIDQVIAEIGNALGGLKVAPISQDGATGIRVPVRKGQVRAAQELIDRVNTDGYDVELVES